jgi:folate-dependent phosphoribosylglycinamide formyltransferase PurN
MKKTYVFTERELASLLNMHAELVESRQLMYSDEVLDRYRGANTILNSAIHKYKNFDEEHKKQLNIDVNELERKAVKILVDDGYPQIVSKELLEKYGYAVAEKEK